jgi:hypothetical protein
MEIESEVNKGTNVSLFIPANFLTILSFSTNEFSASFTKEMHVKNILLLKPNQGFGIILKTQEKNVCHLK